MSRLDRIRQGLDWCVAKGIIRDWYSQTSMPGRRWNLAGIGFSSRTYTTAEVEVFLLGASEGRTSAILSRPGGEAAYWQEAVS